MVKVRILGGGPAGLSAAYFANKNKIPFHLYESSGVVGGNCKTLTFDDCRYDTGAHRFHSKNSIALDLIKLLIKDDLSVVTAPSKIVYKSKLINFPLEPKSLLRDFSFHELIKIFFENIVNVFRGSNSISSFKDSAYRKYGKTVSNKFLINYTEKLWGTSTELLHNEVTGDRFNDLTPISILKNIFKTKESSVKHFEGDFLYPKKGYGQIFDEMMKIVEDNISVNSRAEEIHCKNNMIENIRMSNGDLLETEILISTLPLNSLIKILKPGAPIEIIQMSNRLKFRDLRLAIFTLECDFFSKNASLYFPEKTTPYTRIYEPKNRSVLMAPKGKTCIVVEIPFTAGDSIGSICDNEFLEKIKSHLIKNSVVDKKLFSRSSTIVMPNAYPIITKEAKIYLKKINQYLSSFKNLKIVGRNAQFKYLHTHHIIQDAYCKIKELQ